MRIEFDDAERNLILNKEKERELVEQIQFHTNSKKCIL